MDTYDLKIEKGTKQDIDELEQLYYVPNSGSSSE